MRPGVLCREDARLLDAEVLIVDAGRHLDDGARRGLVECGLDGLEDAVDGGVADLLVHDQRRLHGYT